MRQRYLFIALASFLSFCAHAQRPDSLTTAPRFMLKISIGDLIGAQYSKIHGAAALRMTPKQYVEIGGGKLTPVGIARQRVEWHAFNGYTFDASYRLFSKPLTQANRRPVWWLSSGIAYQYLEGNISGDFSRQDGGYSQRFDYDLKDQRTGGKISGGIFGMLGKRVMIEWGLGMFIFYRKWAFSELPEDVVFENNGSRHWSYNHRPANRRTEMRGFMVLKIGWVFY